MKHEKVLHKHNDILMYLSHLPKHILALDGASNTPEFLLCYLASNRCFNFNKAAYLVDNPDFNCLQGIAGYAQCEEYSNCEHMWQDKRAFSDHMGKAPFNQRVQKYAWCSIDRAPEPNEELIRRVASDLAIEQPSYRFWRLKHGNNGILIFEGGDLDQSSSESLDNSLYFFGFCPIC